MVAWRNQPRPRQPSDENSFSVWVGFKVVCWKWNVCFRHSRDRTRVSLSAPTQSRHFRSYCKSQNSLKYLLTFRYLYSLKYQAAASFWNFCDIQNRGLGTGTYMHTWAWMRNPKASWYHLQVKSLSVRKKPLTVSSSELTWDLLKESPYSLKFDTDQIQVLTNLRTTGSNSGFLRYFVGSKKVIANTWQNTDPSSGKETLQHRNLILVQVKLVEMSPLSTPTGKDSSPYHSQIWHSKIKIASGQTSMINFIYLQINNVLKKKKSCHDPSFPCPRGAALPAHSHTFNRRKTKSNHITAQTVTSYGNSAWSKISYSS